MSKRIDIPAGEKFGKLSVIGDAPSIINRDGGRTRRLLCKCECGVEKAFRYSDLIRRGSKRTLSCGCHRKAQNRARIPNPRRIHGLTSRTTAPHYLYSTWKSIKDRCYNSNCRAYPAYGDRGITMHSPWLHDPALFAAYIRSNLGERPPKHSIDRINNNGNYEPGNLRWATSHEQGLNKRTNVRIHFRGETHTISEWAKILNVTSPVVRHRDLVGWPIDKPMPHGPTKWGQ